MAKKNKDKVYQVYDEIIDWFDNNRRKDLIMEKFYLNFIQKYLPPRSTILDIGCGTGEPIDKFLIDEGYTVIGIDASKKMIDLCKQRFPKERWLLADMRTLDLNEKFHAVIAWHSLFHLPQEDQRSTLKLLASYVEQNGLLMFTSGPESGEAWSENGGQDLYHASLTIEEYEQILINNNFKILVHKVKDQGCGEATVWVAQKI
ncbi:class I SAM-dependent DNA methyltransferase [Legionella sp. CNM-1927-20]|uniref:class I SAM-dependent DNA methyltransferase n=1 Tax=Legionella sp. CNM-1927-20 TaxID=3422221 RepID=UPI00403B1742